MLISFLGNISLFFCLFFAFLCLYAFLFSCCEPLSLPFPAYLVFGYLHLPLFTNSTLEPPLVHFRDVLPISRFPPPLLPFRMVFVALFVLDVERFDPGFQCCRSLAAVDGRGLAALTSTPLAGSQFPRWSSLLRAARCTPSGLCTLGTRARGDEHSRNLGSFPVASSAEVLDPAPGCELRGMHPATKGSIERGCKSDPRDASRGPYVDRRPCRTEFSCL